LAPYVCIIIICAIVCSLSPKVSRVQGLIPRVEVLGGARETLRGRAEPRCGAAYL
jgi:hypothetical protein